MRGTASRILLPAILVVALTPIVEARKVDVGGHKLRVVVKGKGAPVVLLDTGIGDSLDTWAWIMPELAKTTRVVAYDRAGLGKSEPGPEPRTSGQVVLELRALLEAIEEPGPYVLVGHSIGGLNMRLFAARHPADVAGIVLIDPTPVDFPGREAALRTESEQQRMRTDLTLASAGLRRELAAAAESAEQVRAAGALPEVPIILLTASRSDESPAFRQAWIEMQRAMAERLSVREHSVIEQAGHYIHYDRPEVVTYAIRRVVELARAD